MAGKVMHYDWFAAAVAEAFGEYEVAVDAAMCSQLTDDATHKNLECSFYPGGKLPAVTQGEIMDGVYGALTGGFHSDHEKIMVFHFPWGPDGTCRRGVLDPAFFRLAEQLYGAIYHEFRGTPAGEEAVQLAAALVGVYGHGVVDSHAHHSFVGMPCLANARTTKDREWWELLAAVMPDKAATGHSEYKSRPDTVGLKWKRNRQVVDNCLVYLHAATAVWNCLRPDRAVVLGEDSWEIRSPAGTTLPRCVTMMAGVAARKESSLQAECRRLFKEVTGKELPAYRIPGNGDRIWFAFQQAAATRLRDALASTLPEWANRHPDDVLRMAETEADKEGA